MDLIESKTANVNRHPWELSRTKCILDIIKKYHICTAVDIGAGDRFFISKLLPFVSGQLYAVDTGYSEKSNVIDGIYCFNDISELSEMGGREGVILMDVLEHIFNDTEFLKEILKKTAQDSFLFITVPSFQFLFSNHDVYLKHYRRYNRKQLLALIHSNNLYVEKCHYFYSSLFFVRLISLLFKKVDKQHQPGIAQWRFHEKHIITKTFYTLLNLDFYFCTFFAQFHIYLPGLSLLAICRKQGKIIV